MAEDPLRLAKRLLGEYVAARPPRTPPPEGKIVLEASRPERRGTRKKAARSGEIWTDAERMALVRAFLQDEPIRLLVVKHERTVGSLEGELRKIGFDLGY